MYKSYPNSALLFLFNNVLWHLLDINSIKNLANNSSESLHDIAYLARMLLIFKDEEKEVCNELMFWLKKIVDLIPDKQLAYNVFGDILNSS